MNWIRLLILALLPLTASAQVEVRRYATMTELLSANPNAFAVAGRATVVVTGRTNFYDGWSRVLSYSSSDTNAADNSTIFSPSNTNFPGRYRLLYLENATNSSVRAGILPPYGYNAIWINGAWVSITNLFAAGTNMQLTATSNRLTIAMTNLTGASGNPLIATVDGLAFTNLDLVSNGDLYWSVPDFTNLYAQLYPNAVDYDEIQQVSGQRLLGNPSGSAANVSEISIGANLALSGGGVLSALVPAGTNSFQIGVDGVIVNTPNLTDSSEINSSASGTNISFSLLSSSVSLAKLESLNASRLVGRGSSGSGSPEQITLGSGLSLSGTTLNPAVSSFSANGTAISTPNLLNAAEISASISALTNVYMSLNAGSVGFSKIQDVASGVLVGRGASGTGSVSQITLGTGLALTTNGVLSATGTNTTLVRVGGTSVTGPNFLDSTEMDWSIDLSTNISIDLFPASVVFSKLQSISTSRLLGRSTSGSGAIEQIQIGSGLSLSSGTLSATGGGGTNGTAVYVDGVSVTNPNFADAATTGLFDVTSGTNVTVRLPDRNFGSVTVSGSGTTISYNTGSISSNHIASGQISQDKLGTSGTATPTNFLAGDYGWKQVTTNMIPGLNAILATIGTGGSGSTTSNVLQRTGYAEFTIDTGYAIANLVVGGAITNVSVAAGGGAAVGLLQAAVSPARIGTNYIVQVQIENEHPTGLGAPIGTVAMDTKTTTSFDVVTRFSATDGVMPRAKHIIWLLEPVTVGGSGSGGGTGSVSSVGLALPSIFSVSGSPVTTSGTLTGTLTTQPANRVFAGPTTGADATPTFRALVDADIPAAIARTASPTFTGTVTFDTISASTVELPFASAYASADSSSNLVATFNGNSWTNLNGTEIRSGTVAEARIDSAIARDSEVAAGYQPLDADLTSLAAGTAMATAITNAASVGAPLLIVGSTNVAVHLATKAPLASPAFTTSASIGGTNILDYAATHLTEAEASVLYQRTNANLTTVANLTGGTSTNFLAGDGAFKQVTTNMVPGLNAILATIGGGSGEVNTASNLGTPSSTIQGLYDSKSGVDLRFRSIESGTGITLTSNATTVSIASSDTNWNGTPIASGTITNLTTENVNGNWFYDAGNGDIFVDGEFGNVSVVNQFYPFTGSANGTGSASVSTGTEDHPFTGIITSGSSANGGYRYPWVTGFERVANGKMWEVGFMMLNTNHTFGKFGYMSTFAAADSSDSSQISITNGVAIGSNASNGVYSVTGTSYTLSNSNWYRARGVIENGSAIFSILDTNGVVLWSDTNTTRVPLLRSSVTLAVSFWNTNTVATNLIQLDFIGRKTKQRLLR